MKERTKKLFLTLLVILGVLLVGAYFLGVGIFIDTQNPGSLPWYCYLKLPYKAPFRTKIRPGDYIVFRTDRRVLPYYAPGTLFGKRVVGIPGDKLATKGRDFYLNGRFIAHARKKDSLGNPAPLFVFNGTIPEGCYFVLGHHPRSFDSRYWGLVCRDAVLGRLIPFGPRKY